TPANRVAAGSAARGSGPGVGYTRFAERNGDRPPTVFSYSAVWGYRPPANEREPWQESCRRRRDSAAKGEWTWSHQPHRHVGVGDRLAVRAVDHDRPVEERATGVAPLHASVRSDHPVGDAVEMDGAVDHFRRDTADDSPA